MAAYLIRLVEWIVLLLLTLMLIGTIVVFAQGPTWVALGMLLTLAGVLALRAFVWKGGQ